jgi:hypothetical protein
MKASCIMLFVEASFLVPYYSTFLGLFGTSRVILLWWWASEKQSIKAWIQSLIPYKGAAPWTLMIFLIKVRVGGFLQPLPKYNVHYLESSLFLLLSEFWIFSFKRLRIFLDLHKVYVHRYFPFLRNCTSTFTYCTFTRECYQFCKRLWWNMKY